MPPVALVVRRTIAAIAALLTGAAAFVALAGGAGAQSTPPGRIAGMGISPPGTPQQAIANDLPRIRAAGINSATIDVWWDVDAETRSNLSRGAITMSDADLRVAIQRAKVAGLRVLLEPKIWCPRCDGYTWRGEIEPEDTAAFFEDYRAMVVHYADIAQQEGVDIFYLGSEMSLVQDETEQWRGLARDVRRRYSGTLTYGVNWNVMTRVHFWDAVDIVSVSAYFPLSGEAKPTVDELKAAWRSSRDPDWRGRKWFDEVLKLHNDTRKPVFFGEAGYLSSTYAAHKPYDETEAYDFDAELQSDAYQALLETFDGQPWWQGVVWWEWTLSDGREISYSPRNKIAEQLLKGWYVDGWRPTAAQRSFYDPPPPPPTTVAAPGGSGSTGGSGGAPGRTQAAPAPAGRGGSTAGANGGAAGAPQSTVAAPQPQGSPAGPAGADGAGDGGTNADLPTGESAAPDDATSPSRDVAIAMAIAALLLVLLPLSAMARALRRPAPAVEPFAALEEPAFRLGERVGPRV